MERRWKWYKRILSRYYEQSKQRTHLMSCWCCLSPAFFSRISGIDILHSPGHLTIHVSSEPNHGCYHKREFEIPPYFFPLSVNLKCNFTWIYVFCTIRQFFFSVRIHFTLPRRILFLDFLVVKEPYISLYSRTANVVLPDFGITWWTSLSIAEPVSAVGRAGISARNCLIRTIAILTRKLSRTTGSMAIGQKELCRIASGVVHRKQRISARYKSSVSAKVIPGFSLFRSNVQRY